MTPKPPPGFELVPTNLAPPPPPPGFSIVKPEPSREEVLHRQASAQLDRERTENPQLDALNAPGAAETALRGVPVLGSLIDEGRAAVSAGANWATGGGLGQPYEEALAYERARHRRSDEDAPVGNFMTKIASGLATAPLTPVLNASTTLGRIAAGGVTGVGYGAAHGFGEGEGGFGQRLDTAGDYAKLGGGLGAALPAAGAAASGAVNAGRQAAPWIAARLGGNADRIANDVIASRLERSGQTPQTVGQDFAEGAEAARFGANSNAQMPEMLADTSDAMQRLTGSVYRQGGEAGGVVREALEARQGGAPNQMSRFSGGDTGQRGEIEDALARALQLRTSGTARQTEQQIVQRQADDGRRLYDAAYNNPDNFDIGPAIVALGLTRQQYTGPFRAALDRASALFEAPSMGPMTRTNQNFFNMDVRRFDAAKKQLDDMIEAAQRGGENNLARELTQFKNRLLDQVHAPGPNGPSNQAYREAREAWGSAAENREAIDLGRAALRENSEVSVEQFRALTPGQQVLFRQGLLESARNVLGRRRPGNDATLPFQEARVQDLLREVIPNASPRARSAATAGAFGDRSGRFGEYVNRQQRMGQTRNRVLGNSATAQRHQDDAEFAADAFSRVLMGLRGGTNAVLEFVGAALQRATAYRQDVAAALARRLVESDPAARAQILRDLQQRMEPSRFRQMMDVINQGIPTAASSGNAMRDYRGERREQNAMVAGR